MKKMIFLGIFLSILCVGNSQNIRYSGSAFQDLFRSFGDGTPVDEMENLRTDTKNFKIKKRPGVSLENETMLDSFNTTETVQSNKKDVFLNNESKFMLDSFNTTETVHSNKKDVFLNNESKLSDFSQMNGESSDEEVIENLSIVPHRVIIANETEDKLISSTSIPPKMNIENGTKKEISSTVPRKGVENPPDIEDITNSTILLPDVNSTIIDSPMHEKEEVSFAAPGKVDEHKSLTDDDDNKNSFESVDSVEDSDDDDNGNALEDKDEQNNLSKNSTEASEIKNMKPLRNLTFASSTPHPSLVVTKMFPEDYPILNTTASSFGKDTSLNVSLGDITTQSSLGKPAVTLAKDVSAQSSSNTAIIVAILIVISICSMIGFVAYKRLFSYWNRRHYSRVDFLIDGLYEM